MTKEPPPEFSLQVRRGARRIHVIAAARGAPAMVLAIAVFVLAVALAVYRLRAPAAMGQRSMRPSSELPRAASWSATSWAVSTPRPAGASLVLMTRRPLIRTLSRPRPSRRARWSREEPEA